MKTPPIPPADAPANLAQFFSDISEAFRALQAENAALKKRLKAAGIA